MSPFYIAYRKEKLIELTPWLQLGSLEAQPQRLILCVEGWAKAPSYAYVLPTIVPQDVAVDTHLVRQVAAVGRFGRHPAEVARKA